MSLGSYSNLVVANLGENPPTETGFGILGSPSNLSVDFGSDDVLEFGDTTEVSYTQTVFGLPVNVSFNTTYIGTDDEGDVYLGPVSEVEIDLPPFVPNAIADVLEQIITGGLNSTTIKTSNSPPDPNQPFTGEGFNVGDLPVCFALGTLIATADGEVAVETLQIGDEILAADGRTIPVKWIGTQTVHKRFTPRARFSPVRIQAGALGENVPHTDLVVTGDHGVLIGGVMVNAAALVNGTTVDYVSADDLDERVTYYHVETDDHAVIVANGAEAETFVDATTRERFNNYAEFVELYGEPTGPAPVLPYARAFSARQLPSSVAEVLGARAKALGASNRVAA